MFGGDGDDDYRVDNAGDVVTEEGGAVGGTDLVRTRVSYTLSAFVENGDLEDINGAGPRSLTGNAGANKLDGSNTADILDGGTRGRHLRGFAGNDTYVVDDAGDKIEFEDTAFGSGIDTVQAGISYTLGAGLENLTAIGDAAVSLTGNEAANALTGNGAGNAIDGGLGADNLNGAGGNDVLNGGDGGDVLDGGAGADNLAGGDGADNLNGAEGTDFLNGGAGADVLAGGTGDDVFSIDATDLVVEAAGGGTDLDPCRFHLLARRSRGGREPVGDALRHQCPRFQRQRARQRALWQWRRQSPERQHRQRPALRPGRQRHPGRRLRRRQAHRRRQQGRLRVQRQGLEAQRRCRSPTSRTRTIFSISTTRR